MRTNLFLFISLLFLLNSCNNYTGEIRDVQKEGIVISLPDWLEETGDLIQDDLASDVIFQFKSRYRNTYGIVVKNEKGDKTFNQYHQEAIGVLKNFKELKTLLVTDSLRTENGIQLELMGDIETEKIYYWHNTYEDYDNYYQLVLWTRSYDRKQKYTEVIEKVIASFKMN